ncbi:MAG: membrane protein insertase YidC [Rhodospirillales bacterium]
MNEPRNMILAIVLSILILVGFEYFFARGGPPPPQIQQTGEPATAIPGQTESQIPLGAPVPKSTIETSVPSTAPETSAPAPGLQDRAAIIAAGDRVTIKSPRLHGSISLIGGRIDDLTLADYHEELDPNSSEIIILTPKDTENSYFAEFGWVSADGGAVPGSETQWTADRETLSPDQPVAMSWDNGKGLKFTRTFSLDENFMFTVAQRVENSGPENATLFPYGLISRRGTPKVTGYVILHEGMLGVFDGTLVEEDYEDVQEEGTIEFATTGGWMGITDKYWLSALIPGQTAQVKARFVHRKEDGTDKYQVDFLGRQIVIAPGDFGETQTGLFVGAKEVTLLDGYEEDLGIARFDLAIDFGWLYFLTKPIFYTLIYINDKIGNFGVSILLLTVLIKLLFFPLANKSYVAMSKMKKLQPEMVSLRERFGDDKTRLNQEMMTLYKREKANPASGCLPIVVQIPVFFALYKVLFVTIEIRHAPLFGWIQDLSVPDPTSIFNLFGILPFTPPDALMIGVWPLIMGISMFLQQKLNPQPPDPIQAKIFLFLPIMFTFLLARFPAGLVIYWAWNNTLSMLQQWVIMRRMGVKV